MSREVSIEELREHLVHTRERLSREKQDILNLHQLPDSFSREEYAFAYMRAERLGMRAINRRLSEIDWLPMHLDPKSEMLVEGRNSLKRWLTSAFTRAPDSDDFGNDFIHALARCGFKGGWDEPEFITLSARIANLFRDLSCLLGTIYYCTWLSENNVAGIPLSHPEDINRTAEEIAALMQSPEIFKYMKAVEQNDERKKSPARSRAAARPPKKKRPALHVIENKNFLDPFLPQPDPVTV